MVKLAQFGIAKETTNVIPLQSVASVTGAYNTRDIITLPKNTLAFNVEYTLNASGGNCYCALFDETGKQLTIQIAGGTNTGTQRRSIIVMDDRIISNGAEITVSGFVYKGELILRIGASQSSFQTTAVVPLHTMTVFSG